MPVAASTGADGMPHISPDADAFRPCIVIPVFNHGGAIAGVIDRLRSFGLPCWLIDDGSSADCATILDALAGAESRIGALLAPV